MTATVPDIQGFLKEYWASKKGSLVFDYATAVSVCGSLDLIRLVAYDKDHEIYYERSITWEDLERHSEWAYSAVIGPAAQELYADVRKHEETFLSAQS